MTVTKKGMMVQISGDGNNLASNLINKPHVARVRKATWMRIKEMQQHPNWIKYVNSLNGNNPNNGINDGEGVSEVL